MPKILEYYTLTTLVIAIFLRDIQIIINKVTIFRGILLRYNDYYN